MFFNQALFFLTTLGLQLGFGIVLGLLVSHAKEAGWSLRRSALAVAFMVMIYLPGCIVVSNLDNLPLAIRGLILLMSIVVVFPLSAAEKFKLQIASAGSRWRLYPAACMLLLAVWSLLSFFFQGPVVSAPLAISATAAGLTALQRS